ncbi:MAG: serine hydrolase [Candidatus Aminicenantes bacterium]|nr:serine hydrolase [Candidatus Aminicenantes bacterium]
MKSKIWLSIIFILCLSALSCAQGSNLTAKLEEYMLYAEKAGFSGSVLVAKDSEILMAQGYGWADKENKIPFTASTVSSIGSVTKQFTGAGILKLQMMGKIRHQDPITKYFKDVPEDKKDITLHHLLTHTAGFPGAIGPDFDPVSRDEFIEMAMQTDLKRKPGTLYEYSNVGYSLLGIIIELVSGKPYEQFLFEHLFFPAGMTQTGYLIPDWDKNKLAHGYRGDRDWGTLLDHPWLDSGPGWHLRANGGILSTVQDMYKWHKALEGTEVLGEKEKHLFYHPHVREGEDADSFYGYGWALFTTPRDTKLIAHNGGNPYFSADFLRYVDEDVVILVLANTNSYRAWKVSEALARVVFGYDYTLPEKPKPMDMESKTGGTSNESWGLPDSITGRRSAAFLSAIHSQDPEKARRFIEQTLAPDFLEEFSLEEHLHQFQKMQEEIGEFELMGALKTGDYSVKLKLKSKTSGQIFEVSLDLESAPPHKIIGIGIDIRD